MNYPTTANFRQISILTMIREITVGIFLSSSGKTINSDLLLPKCWQNNLIIFPNYFQLCSNNSSKFRLGRKSYTFLLVLLHSLFYSYPLLLY